MLQAEQDALVVLAQQGDEDAFTMLYRKLTPELIRFGFRVCRDHQMASDLVQEVWLSSLKSIRRLDDPRVFRSWMYRAVKWKALDAVRYTNRVTELDERELAEVAEESESDESRVLLSLVSQLPQEEQQTVYLFYASELKLDEIAIVLEVPVGTVKSRLNRSRNKLKDLWEKQNESG